MSKKLITFVIIPPLLWWLFADTYARHFSDARDDGVVRFSHFGSYEDYTLWGEVIADFELANPSIRVQQEYVVGLSDRYNVKMRQQILSNTLPDVALVQLGPFHELAEHFDDLSDLLSWPGESGGGAFDGWDSTGLAAFQHLGDQKGLPVSGGSLLIYGNFDCLERAGKFLGKQIATPLDDWTMENFHSLAKQLTCDFDGDGRIDQFGFWLPRWIYYLPFLWSFGAEVTDPVSGEWRLVGAKAEAAFTFYRELAVGGRVCPRYDEVPQLFQDVGFLTGRTALCVNGPWFMPFLEKTDLADSYFVAPIPQFENKRATRITWDGVVIPKELSTRRRSNAARFVRFLLSRSVQERIGRMGRAVPARKDALHAFLDVPDDSRRRPFVEALSYSRLQPLWPRFSEVDRTVNRYLARLADGFDQATPSEMLRELASDRVIRDVFGSTDDGGG